MYSMIFPLCPTRKQIGMSDKKKSGNMQRMKLALFIPWDKDGRIYLDEHSFITKDTEIRDVNGAKVEDGNIIKFPDGVLLKGKK